MKILIIIPSFSQHGGIRNLVSWANGLLKWNRVGIYSIAQDNPSNMWVHPDIRIIKKTNINWDQWDCLIIGSPHGINYQDAPVKKKVIFLQQCEHLFRPQDKNWQAACFEFYRTKYPMILYSQWNHHFVHKFRRGPTYYLGTSVSTIDFPIMLNGVGCRGEKPGDENGVVLVEGWECTNPTKDKDQIGPKVAQQLRKDGYRIIAFSQRPLKTMPRVPHEYYQSPSLSVLNGLYERATILLKATINDARSAAPLEAMTKGTPTARAIDRGDDDLQNNFNCLRCGYNEDELYSIAKRLLTDHELRNKIAMNGFDYIRKNSWGTIMPKVNDIIQHS